MAITTGERRLLLKLIEADQDYRDRRSEVTKDVRLVEIGTFNGVDPRTARSLVNSGLAVYDCGKLERKSYVRLVDVAAGEIEVQ